jgi:predicted ribosome quality control (RQC) complex YloA/Tae2 family protein
VGLFYSLENRQNFGGIPPLTKERVREALSASLKKTADNVSTAKKLKGKPGGDLRRSLAVSITELPPVLVDHTLQANNFDTTMSLTDVLASDSILDELVALLVKARETVESITSSSTCKGYIFAKYRTDQPSDKIDDSSTKREDLLYEDFHPFLPQKLEKDPSIKVIELAGYNETVDEFFSSLEGQRLESRILEREAAAKKRLDAAKQDQAKRIEGLQEVQLLNYRKAAAIETNVERVQEAMDAVNGLLAQGMDWVDIGKLVEREQKRNNPVAEIIKLPLKLSENIITLTLAEEDIAEEAEEDPFETDDSDAEEDDNTTKRGQEKEKPSGLSVDINLTESPWSNAREYYEQRKTAAVKEEKTQQQAVKAIKNTEQKIAVDLKKGLKQEKALLQPIRKQMWFEKFLWFISSDGYLVIGGKDAQQNEMLYKRYLRKGDVYCHADLRGASSVIIKNNPATPDAPIPPATLAQAGSLSVCSSEAWDSKAGMGAWWVNADQVSKSAPAGEFLPAGSFMVRGKKNFLPPAPLLLGFGVMFKISEESKAKHVKHRLREIDPTGETGVGQGAERLELSEMQDDADQASEPSNPRDGNDDDDRDNEDGSEDEDDGDKDESPRDNPLQGLGKDQEDNDDNIEDNVSGLRISSDSAELKGANEDDDAKSQEQDDATAEYKGDEDRAVSEASDMPSKTQGDTASQGTAQTTSSNRAPARRGQKGKAKKIAKKYKDQDEEDRAAAEALIGATAGRQKAEAEAAAKAAREAEQAALKERRRAQHQRDQKATAEHEEIRKVMMDEGVELLDESESDKATPLDSLVGKPLAGDEIVELIPVCAPWSALSKCKYKTKLQPGATKKGKAIKEILEVWKSASGKKGVVDERATDTEKMWPREVELIKGLKPEEVVNCIPVSKVRIMQAGGAGGGGGGKSSAAGKGGGKGGKGGKGSKR